MDVKAKSTTLSDFLDRKLIFSGPFERCCDMEVDYQTYLSFITAWVSLQNMEGWVHIHCLVMYSLISTHTAFIQWRSVSGLHADGAVQSDHLPVDHGVLGQRRHQVGELGGVSQPRGEGHLASQKGAHLLRETGQERGGEQTWRERGQDPVSTLIWSLNDDMALKPDSGTSTQHTYIKVMVEINRYCFKQG